MNVVAQESGWPGAYAPPPDVVDLGDPAALVLRDLEVVAREYPRFRNLRRDGAELLFELVLASKPKAILELGTANGYSTLWLGLAARHVGASVLSVENQAWKLGHAKAALRRARLLDTVSLHHADALRVCNSPDTNCDFLFLDIWPGDYVDCVSPFADRLPAGSVVVADNMMEHRDRVGTPMTSHAADREGYESYMRSLDGWAHASHKVGCGFLISKSEGAHAQ